MFRKVQFPAGLSACVLTYPQVFIVIPLLITFLVSYSPLLSRSSAYEVSNTYLSKTSSVYEHMKDDLDYNYLLTKVIIQPDDGSNALSKSFLIDSLAAQTKIMHNISELSILHSPFDLWGNDIDFLRSDRTPITTVNENLHKIPMFLFQGLVKVNGHVSFAKRLSFTVLSSKENSAIVTSLLRQNVEDMNKISDVSKFFIFVSNADVVPGINNNISGDRDTDPKVEMFQFHISKLNTVDYLIIFVIYCLIASFFVYNMERMKSVKSIGGISIAILAQLVLTLYTGKAVTCFFFKTSSDNIPWFLIYVPIMFASLSNLFKLTIEKKGTMFYHKESILIDADGSAPDSDATPFLSSQQNFLNSIAKSNHYTLRTTLSTLMVLIIIAPFSRKVSCFFITALVTNLFLQITYFSAVISLDHRRFTYNELLALSNDDSVSDLDLSLDKEYEQKVSKWTEWIDLLTEVKHWLPKTEVLSTSSILTALYMLYLNTRFSSIRSSSSMISKMFTGKLFLFSSEKLFSKVIFDRRFISNELYTISGSTISSSNILLNDPLIVIKNRIPDSNISTKTYDQILNTYNLSSTNTYKFDVFYFVEFSIFLLLLLVSTLLVLQLIVRKLDNCNIALYETSLEERKKKFSGRQLQRKPSIPIDLKTDPNKNVFHTKELSNNGHQLDIVDIATSQSPFVVSIGLDHKVLVWSPLNSPMPPPTQIPVPTNFGLILHTVLSNDGSYLAFFNNSGRITCWSRQSKSFIWNFKLDAFDGKKPLEAFFRKRTVPGFSKRKPMSGLNTQSTVGLERTGSIMSLKSLASLSSGQFGSSALDTKYENFSNYSPTSAGMDELVFVNSSNCINVISHEGEFVAHKITCSEHNIKSCKRLLTPRMNERLVLCDETGDLYVSTVVNNKWKTRKLLVLQNRFNKGKGLMTPRSLGMRIGGPVDNSNETLNESGTSISTIEPSETDNTLLLVPFVGFAVRTSGHYAELIDIQSGTSIKKIKIGDFKSGTLRVFHDQPTHCKFCGSASVATLSIAYTSLKNSLIMHSFHLESKTKTSICLRVERDPREIRCLGLESVVEKKYHLSNVDRWEVTENNMLIGIRRKPEMIGTHSDEPVASSSMTRSVSATGDGIDNRFHNRNSKGRAVKRANRNSFDISNVWEGWTMNANGKVIFHEIPVGVNGLLVNRIGPLKKFGTKSIVVGFGNIMKMFYVGHEEFVLEADTAGVNEENSGLRYVNKRRDRLVHKISTNYEIITDC